MVAFRAKFDQKGMASLIITGILAILLTIISVGFAVVMNRSLRDALADQQSTAATAATHSAINLIAQYLQNTVQPDLTNLPDTTKSCNDPAQNPLFDSSSSPKGPLANPQFSDNSG